MSQRLLQKVTARNGEDYVRRPSKVATRRQLKRSAERSSKPSPSDRFKSQETSDRRAEGAVNRPSGSRRFNLCDACVASGYFTMNVLE